MAVDTLTEIPAIIECGNTVIFTEIFTDFDSADWTVKLYVSKDGVSADNWAGSGSGTTWTFTLPAADTSALTPGTYSFAFYATETATSQRTVAKTGAIEFIPDLTGNQDPSNAQAQLTALEATIVALNGSQNQSVSFNGQSFTKKDITILYKERTRLKAEVIAEKRKADALRGIRRSNCVAPTFTAP